jgi:hypothetical protein
MEGACENLIGAINQPIEKFTILAYMALDIETAKYLAEKSKEWIGKQMETYREKRSVASTIIGLNALFIPFFLGGIADSVLWVKYMAGIPTILICIALYYLIRIYYLQRLSQGLDKSGYGDAINKSYEHAILYEIGVNKQCIENNDVILENVNKSYKRGILFTQLAIGLSVIVLSLNMYNRPDSDTIKIEISNLKKKP